MIPVNLDDYNLTKAFPLVYPVTEPFTVRPTPVYKI